MESLSLDFKQRSSVQKQKESKKLMLLPILRRITGPQCVRYSFYARSFYFVPLKVYSFGIPDFFFYFFYFFLPFVVIFKSVKLRNFDL